MAWTERAGRPEPVVGLNYVLVVRLLRVVRAAAAAEEHTTPAWCALGERSALAAYRRCLDAGLADDADEALHALLPDLGPKGRVLVLWLRTQRQ